MRIGLILLAAGSSTRMGQSKQLLPVEGVPLLVHSARTAIESNLGKVVVVLGANESEHRKAIAQLDVEVVSNPNWESGMGSSLKAGLKHLLAILPGLEVVLVMVCDQPLLNSAHLTKLADGLAGDNRKIIASSYSGTAGVPALFHKTLFSEILQLPDNEGARGIINRHSNERTTVDFPEGAVDLDTPEQYDRFLNQS